jgi:RNA polymerase sigma-70 factor, ECF subfamily
MFTVDPGSVEAEAIADSTGLVALAKRGDVDAFCRLCDENEVRVFRQAVALCGDLTMAEDLAQETFVEAWKCLSRFNERCQFFTWLCAILLHRYQNVVRRRRPLPLSSLSKPDKENADYLLDHLVDQRASPDEIAACVEQALALRECIQQLPAKHREVIYLRFYVGDSLEGIAAVLGCSIGTVKSRLFHALERLRSMRRIASEAGARVNKPN